MQNKGTIIFEIRSFVGHEVLWWELPELSLVSVLWLQAALEQVVANNAPGFAKDHQTRRSFGELHLFW